MQTVANQNTSVARAAASRPRRRDAVGLWLQVVTASAALVFVVVGSAWSAPLIGGTIAYVQGTEAFEIYVVEAGDSPPVRVWREEDDRIYSVKLSRDRQRVAFEAGRLGVSRQVFIVNVDGTDHRQVTNFGQGVDSAGTAWSPDGTRIAFGSEVRGRGGDAALSVAPGDGGAPRALVAAAMKRLGDPAWSPDGTNIAYTASRRVANSPALRLLNVATGETTLLSVEGRGDVAWSPGGTQLAFHHFDRDRGSWGIVVMTARRGGKRRRVVEMDRWHPTRGLVWVDVGHIAHLSPTNVRAIHTMDLAGRPQSPVYVEAGAPIHAFDWVDPARPVRPAGKRPTTLGGLKAGEDVW